jgi:hypothetical protein
METGQGPCGACMIVEDGVSAMSKTAEAIAVDFALSVPEHLSVPFVSQSLFVTLTRCDSRRLSPLDPPPDRRSA